MTEIILQYVDAPAVALFAVYLWRETKRLRSKNDELRSRLDKLHKRHTDYVKQQAKLWRQVSTNVKEARERLRKQNGNSTDA